MWALLFERAQAKCLPLPLYVIQLMPVGWLVRDSFSLSCVGGLLSVGYSLPMMLNQRKNIHKVDFQTLGCNQSINLLFVIAG
jgi:hypothetical protein